MVIYKSKCHLWHCSLDPTDFVTKKSADGLEEPKQMLCRLLKMQGLHNCEEKMAAGQHEDFE